MKQFRFTNKAVDDISNIWNYTFYNWSETQADKYYHMLLANCQQLANSPEIGKPYHEIAKNLCGLKAGRHIIFFQKLSESEIIIIRILHEQMDFKNRITETNLPL